MQTHTAEPQRMTQKTVCVNGWRYLRQVRIGQDQIGLQVTVPSCSHCPTCQRRVREFKELLADKPNQIHQWKWEGGAEWLYVPVQAGSDALETLRHALELRID
jgi:hypothetical protein